MRLLHTSDWHLGRRLHGEDLHAHHKEFLRWLVRTAVAEQVDAVLVSGDVYDRAQPPAESVRLLDDTLAAFVTAGVPLVLSAGNHDSAVRLQYGGAVMSASGIHVRTSLADAARPVILTDAHGAVAVYGVPYLLPDAVCSELAVQRSHEAVLSSVVQRIRADAAQRGMARTVVLAHAFVTGGQVSDSERDISVGGIGDAPAAVFDGITYVALGHLHGPQTVPVRRSDTVLAYSGSPLAFSFSEAHHSKSVTLVEIDGGGTVTTRRIATPVPRTLREVRGRLEDLLDQARSESDDLRGAWVKATLTDPGRVAGPLEQLRAVWPHTLVLAFEPERADADEPLLAVVGQSADPVQICADFVRVVSGTPASAAQREILSDVVGACRQAEAVA